MRKSLIFASLCLCASGLIESARAQSAPPVCGAGTWAVRSSRSATGWVCSNQTPSDTPASDSGSTTGRHHRGGNGSGSYGNSNGSSGLY
jgi:hypothetical protein